VRDAFAQPDDARERVDDTEPAARRPRQQQAAIVRTKIERAIDFAALAIGLAIDPRSDGRCELWLS
jgi:hypothetical protein